jgi:hypothetical protein
MLRKNGATGSCERILIVSSTTGLPQTGLTYASAGLKISTVADVETGGTAYSGANITAIATIGTYAAPAAGKCGFGEVDSVNHPGLYEIQLANARYSVANADQLDLCVQATGCLAVHEQIQLTGFDPTDGVRMGMTSLPPNTNLAVAATTMQQGNAITGTLTAGSFTTNLTSSEASEYVNRAIRFTSGVLAGQEQVISAYAGTGSVGTVTVSTAFTGAPANNDTFIIV